MKKNKNLRKNYFEINEDRWNLINSFKFGSLVDPEFKSLSLQNQINRINEMLDKALNDLNINAKNS